MSGPEEGIGGDAPQAIRKLTPGKLVIQRASRQTLARSVVRTPSS